MKVSVITATYNRAHTIVRALGSVRNQTYKNIELVVIDGGSTDNTIGVISHLISTEDMVYSGPDDGIYDALNKGLESASGDIIAFLHSDDLYFDENVLSFITDVFVDESIDIVYGDICFFSEMDEGNIVRTYKSDQLSLKNLAWGKMPAHPAIFCRRKVFETLGGFKLDYKIAADYEFLCRLVKKSNFTSKYVNKNLVRMQTGGASRISLKNTALLNREVYRAIKTNGIYTNYFMILSKYASKLFQFLKS